MTKLVFIAVATSVVSMGFLKNLHNNNLDVKIAEEIVEKKNDLKEYAALQAIKNKGMLPHSIHNVSVSNIKRVVVPSDEYSNRDIILLSQYQQAVEEFYKNNDPAFNVTCNNLINLSKNPMKLSDCTEIIAKDFRFYEYDKGKIAFSVPIKYEELISNIEPRLKVMARTSTEVTYLDDDITTKYTYKVSRKQKQLVASINKKIDTALDKDDYLVASKLVANLSQFNTDKSIYKAERVLDAINSSPTIEATTKKDVAKNLYMVSERIKSEHLNRNRLSSNVQSAKSSSTNDIDNQSGAAVINDQVTKNTITNIDSFVTSNSLTTVEKNELRRQILLSSATSRDSVSSTSNDTNLFHKFKQ